MKTLSVQNLFFASLLLIVAAPLFASEKPIVVIIPSYNNAQWYHLNVGSVLTQRYNNFRVIYIDDCSTDNTYNLVKNFVEQSGFAHKVTLIRNVSRRGALANLYSAIHTCEDKEIVVTVDGDDWLKNNTVLSIINQTYQDPNVWLTHGHYVAHPNYEPVHIKELSPGIIQKNLYREWDWVTTHLRTFYAGLFKKIKLQDLIYNGSFFQVTWDLAMLMPMLEMAGGKIKRIHDVLYVYNCATDSNDFKTKLVEQIHCDKIIRARRKYEPLKEFDNSPANIQYKVSLVMFADESPKTLKTTLESVQQKVRNVHHVSIICSHQQMNHYKELEQHFPSYIFLYVSPHTFKSTLLNVISQSHEYIIMARSSFIIKSIIDGAESAKIIEHAGAHSFYFSLGKNVNQNPALDRMQKHPKFILLHDDIYAWQFKDGEHDWRMPFSCVFSMMRKKDLLSCVKEIHCENAIDLETKLKTALIDLEEGGLCFEESKVTFTRLKQNECFEEEES